MNAQRPDRLHGRTAGAHGAAADVAERLGGPSISATSVDTARSTSLSRASRHADTTLGGALLHPDHDGRGAPRASGGGITHGLRARERSPYTTAARTATPTPRPTTPCWRRRASSSRSAQPAAISTTPPSASATPICATRCGRSPRNTAASATVVRGIERAEHGHQAHQAFCRGDREETVGGDVERADRRSTGASDSPRLPGGAQ